MKVFLVAGARPNFMKIAPIFHKAHKLPGINCKIVHTGQHYDYEMSESFFKDLELPRPEYFLNVGPGSHSEQTAKIMIAFEKICIQERPDLIIVVGDVNSTLSCSIVGKKCNICVAHVEAGLRSFDMSMPEEINRIVTDCLSDIFFITEESAYYNLINEGRNEDNIFFTGHIMIDNLFNQLKKIDKINEKNISTFKIKEKYKKYAFLTLHRPANVDNELVFRLIAKALNEISDEYIILFPVHPRTQKKIKDFNIKFSKNIKLLPPLNFKESLCLWKDAQFVLTDSGGLQEETTALKKPCLTLRKNTERPITIEIGSNRLAGNNYQSIITAYENLKLALHKGFFDKVKIPPMWDGRASERIWAVIEDRFM